MADISRSQITIGAGAVLITESQVTDAITWLLNMFTDATTRPQSVASLISALIIFFGVALYHYLQSGAGKSVPAITEALKEAAADITTTTNPTP
jgi:hypothetical protein